jgi:hypothetical protein
MGRFTTIESQRAERAIHFDGQNKLFSPLFKTILLMHRQQADREYVSAAGTGCIVYAGEHDRQCLKTRMPFHRRTAKML